MLIKLLVNILKTNLIIIQSSYCLKDSIYDSLSPSSQSDSLSIPDELNHDSVSLIWTLRHTLDVDELFWISANNQIYITYASAMATAYRGDQISLINCMNKLELVHTKLGYKLGYKSCHLIKPVDQVTY